MLTTVRRSARRAVDGFSRESDLGWRWGRNAGPSMRYRREGGDVALTDAGRATVETLRRDGVAVTSVEDLLAGDPIVDEVRARVEALVEAHGAEIAERRAALGTASPEEGKSYLIEMLGLMPAVTLEDPLARFVAHPRVRGIAEAYSRMRLRVYDYNAWYNIAHDGEAIQSQRWHRDLPEDHDIVKVFLYVRDVPEGAGPMSYVTGSHAGAGRRIRLPETFDGIGYRYDDADVLAVAGEGSIASVPGPAGTVVFADTRGLHRGGWARTDDRVVVQGLYASRSCNRPGVLVPRDERDRNELVKDFALLSPEAARRRAEALGVLPDLVAGEQTIDAESRAIDGQ